jgi:DnaJ like chaperone protein
MNLPNQSPSAFIVCAFSMLGKIAAADGRVCAKEVERVERSIDEELKLDAPTKEIALEVFEEAFESPLELRDYAERFAQAFPDRVQLADKMMRILLAMSAADDELSPEEDKILRSAALLLGLSLPAYDRLKGEAFKGK